MPNRYFGEPQEIMPSCIQHKIRHRFDVGLLQKTVPLLIPLGRIGFLLGSEDESMATTVC